jgi:hypothetical protein
VADEEDDGREEGAEEADGRNDGEVEEEVEDDGDWKIEEMKKLKGLKRWSPGIT